MKNLLTLLFLVVLTCSGRAQTQNWTEVTQQSGVTISAAKTHCSYNRGFDEERVVFKFENTSNQDLTITWHFTLYYDGVCRTCGQTGEYDRTLTIPANSTLEGSCTNHNDPNLSVFSKFDDPNYNANTVTNYSPQTLTDYEFTNLQVSPN